MIHLDTSFLIRSLVAGSAEDSALRQWIASGEELGMCTVAWAEFLCGPVDETTRDLAAVFIQNRIEFSEQHATVSAELFNQSGRRRGSIIDCMIAAAAICDNASIATANTRDFRKFENAGLRLAV